MLCSNRLATLSDLDPLVSLSPSLRTLSLMHNPCAKLADYRAYVIHLLPQLHSLDFAKVKPKVSRSARNRLMQSMPRGWVQVARRDALCVQS